MEFPEVQLGGSLMAPPAQVGVEGKGDAGPQLSRGTGKAAWENVLHPPPLLALAGVHLLTA